VATRHRGVGRLRLAGLLLVLLVAALAGVNGTYALWRDSTTIDLGAVETATAGLSARWDSGSTRPDARNLLPGERARQTLTVQNTGDVPLELSASLETARTGLEIRLQRSAAGAPLTSAALTTQPASVPDAAGSAVILSPGATATLTAEVTATAALAPGASLDYSLIIEGTQTR
jgi:hypothetical protein